VGAEAEAVEPGAGAEDGVVAGEGAGQVGKRIRGIGDGHQNRIGGGTDDLRHDVAVDLGIFLEKLEAAFGVAAVGGTTGFLVLAGGDQDDAGAGEVGVGALGDGDAGAERDAVAKVGGNGHGAGLGAVDNDDLTSAVAQGQGHETGRADAASPDYAYFHGVDLRLVSWSGNAGRRGGARSTGCDFGAAGPAGY
jgi:hypothetical protein